MINQLDTDYFHWLASHVVSVKSRANVKTYWSLLQMLHDKEFIWFIPNDDNRVMEGKSLYLEYLEESGIEDWVGDSRLEACSFLEMVLALSRRVSQETDRGVRWWFWHFMKNLELDVYNDYVRFTVEEIDDILDAVIFRTYDYHGRGGLFPLENPQEDQRRVEIWYQMNAYLLERF